MKYKLSKYRITESNFIFNSKEANKNEDRLSFNVSGMSSLPNDFDGIEKNKMISELKLKLGKEDERLCLEIKIICQIIINKDDNDILVKDEIERNCTELSIRMVIDVANNLLEFYQMEGISIPPIEEMQDVEDE
ncbi:hypothetical protein HMPREF9488_03132 [Coprobacillus cateniformis]|jgi:hypothetical protein|uniref:Uncharacterized protein n=1 Tax=Coprobacillus cateniformis TaxID=100884 RepID=E7GEJ0_9FIRM|nr:hypothetical protein [Coprobacillus cateniformis]EFW03441.1 hypothetical protein HMPREF9488_03132 [Coprobacillus cateniformis]RGO15691.1 hypothetical protein DXB30_07630 [Coprobacillus cateniformis]RGO24852.1 hypothetical protein DXB26_07720 [Coprobacillus cateniformis]